MMNVVSLECGAVSVVRVTADPNKRRLARHHGLKCHAKQSHVKVSKVHVESDCHKEAMRVESARILAENKVILPSPLILSCQYKRGRLLVTYSVCIS